MKRARKLASSLAAALLLFGTAHSSPPPGAQAEINYLLSTVAASDCEFFRNGSWYPAKAAAAHLSSKFQYLEARDLVHSAEDFIEKAAARSSASGRPYAIRCKGSNEVPSREWLFILLARYRESHLIP